MYIYIHSIHNIHIYIYIYIHSIHIYIYIYIYVHSAQYKERQCNEYDKEYYFFWNSEFHFACARKIRLTIVAQAA